MGFTASILDPSKAALPFGSRSRNSRGAVTAAATWHVIHGRPQQKQIFQGGLKKDVGSINKKQSLFSGKLIWLRKITMLTGKKTYYF